MKKYSILWLLCIALVYALGSQAQADVVTEFEVTNAAIAPLKILQGDALTISYRVRGGGKKLSATAFVRQGSVESVPQDWQEGAVRCEPSYQIWHEDMRGKAKNARCVLSGHTTSGLAPGTYSVFVAINNPPSAWQVTKLGEFTVLAADSISVPERGGQPLVAVWKDNVMPAGSASNPDHIAELVREAGCSPTFLSSAQLANKNMLNRDRFDLLILPYGGSFPLAAEKTIASFLEDAGAILSIGGPALTNAIHQTEETNAPRVVRKIADMENGKETWRAMTENGPKTSGKVEAVRPGAKNTRHALRVNVPELKDWFYVCFPLRNTGGAQDVTIKFWAKGDENTEKLCLELNEEDGSRWKYFIRLTTQWREYSVTMTNFASYANSSRGFVGDRFHPEKAIRLKMGFYRALFDDESPRTFWIDEIERCSVKESPPDMTISHWQEWARDYAYLKARPPASGLGLFRGMRRLEGITLITAASGQRVIDASARLSGTFAGWEIAATTELPKVDRWSMGVVSCARQIPLLEGYNSDGKQAGALATLLFNYRGPYRGSSCAFFCVDTEDIIADNAAMKRTFVETVRRLTAPVYLFDIDTTFSVNGEALRETWHVRVANLAREPKSFSARARVLSGDTEANARVRLNPGEIRKLSFTFDATRLDLKRFGVRILLEHDGRVVDELVSSADALTNLQAAADWLLSNQKPAGNFSNIYYADMYGARALHALGRITGERRYIKAATRVADMMVHNQRDDGGWWVGYGTPGECVFVADDGCISLGLVALTPHVNVARRRRYLDAAERFVQFRERFRITDEVARRLEKKFGKGHKGIKRGGLGIGYVRTDYFAKKRYPGVTREMRQYPWTLHCSLAFLGGLWRATKEERFRRLAIQDAQWFLARVEEGSDSVTGGYANEAAIWIFDTVDDSGLRAKLKDVLESRFINYVETTERRWWTASGGRGALLLPGLVYCSRRIKPTVAVKAALARALWSLCGDASPLSISRIVQRYPTTASSEVVMYVCFSSVGLAELSQQGSTMMPQ